ncbi:ATP-binding protein [Halobium palmae]|uniref:ATP-binding protein n=1 Tax=Halobium palmae TaxID=1776492 RepID=A0ABD5RU89_9EURY
MADNSPGVADDETESIFGRNEKGLESAGTGIGLYLAATLVERYEGAIWVTDNEPRGAVFHVRLHRAS